jgi:lipoprotein-anchoring transpeptidase ErfK/SrfK
VPGERRDEARRRGAARVKRLAPILVLPLVTAGVLAGMRFAGRASPPHHVVTAARDASTSGTGCRWENALIGTAVVPTVEARAAPSARSSLVASFGRTNPQGDTQVFLFVGERTVGTQSWFRALLPVRPNGTTGFIARSDVSLSQTPYHLTVSRAQRRLALWKGCREVKTYPVGIGTKFTPTPVGTFYLASLMKPPSARSVYGVYAYGLSGYSGVIRNWRWGGVIGLHGTDDPSSIGHYTSHGCIRMYNRDVEQLVRILPLGTPITIT